MTTQQVLLTGTSGYIGGTVLTTLLTTQLTHSRSVLYQFLFEGQMVINAASGFEPAVQRLVQGLAEGKHRFGREVHSIHASHHDIRSGTCRVLKGLKGLKRLSVPR